MARGIDYGRLMHHAMRGLIRQVLEQIAQSGLPGSHHFFISFDTTHPGVEMADWLRERYPEEMTIVLQHWFDALDVSESGFAVTLNFGNQPERMRIPFDALRTFVDPSVEFGLRFESHDEEEEEDEDDKPAEEAVLSLRAPGAGAEVVSLDKWRK
jgi:hypothetical protein